ncbi:MAG: hypothetical protein ACRD23_03905 [Terriglobales bacterium]
MTANAKINNRSIIRTSGKIFADGAIIDLVQPVTDRQPQLLWWRKHLTKVAPQIEYRGHVYQAVDAEVSLLRAICFPTDAEDYGSAQKLFAKVSELFGRYIGLALPEAALLTAWTCTTWFPECASSPPTLVISGPDMGHGITLLRLLGCLCRRSLVLSDISRSGLVAAMRLKPTLLVNQPGQFRKLWHLLGTSNFHGVYVLGNQGRVNNLAGCRAFFVGMEQPWNDGALHLALPPARTDLPTLDEPRQVEIAKSFQPKWLMYRLRSLSKVHASHSSVLQLKFPETEMAHNLAACIQGDPEIAQAIAPILQRQDQDAHVQRGCDVNRALVEVVLSSLHEKKECSVSRLAELTNALLRCRGETLEYSPSEIGWKLRNLGLYRQRNGSGMVFRLSRENSQLVHQLARSFNLNLPPVQGCPDCVNQEVIAPE